MSTINNDIPFVPENTVDPAAGLNLALNVVDALLQLRVLSVGENVPPASPADGDRHVIGETPTGAWAGEAGRLARWLDGGWSFYDATFAVNFADGLVYANTADGWEVVGGSGGTFTLPEFTVATIPAAAPAAQMIYVSDETGGAVPAFSDGTDWRRVTDREIIS